MSNITDVRLENFQSHLDSRFTFTDGLNVLIGQSDSGKTAVIRGIRWALFNQPRGTDFIRAGSDFVRVTVQFENGDKIIRERTASKNRYMIKKAGEEQQVFESFGQHVPEEVLSLHGMRPLRIDRDHELTIHLAQQLDGPFMLEQPGSMRAKTIGRISGAHYLDAAIRDTSRDLSSLNQSKRWSEEQTEQLQKDLEPYENVVAAGERLQKASSQLEELKSKQAALEGLRTKQQDLLTNKQTIHDVSLQLEAVANLPKMELLFQQLQVATFRQTALLKLQEQYQSHTQQTKAVKQQLQLTETIEQAALSRSKAEQLEDKRKKLAYLHEQYVKLNRVKEKAHHVLDQTNFVRQVDTSWQDTIKQLEQKRQRLVFLLDQYQSVHKQINEQQTQKENTLRVEKLNDMVSGLDQTHERFQLLLSKQQNYNDVAKRIQDGKTFVHKQKLELEELQNRYEELLKKDGICPTCGQTIQKAHSH